MGRKKILMPRYNQMISFCIFTCGSTPITRGADKSLAGPGREQARKHVRDARDFNNIETWAVIKFFFLQCKAPKDILAILTEILTCLLPGRAKDLSASINIKFLNSFFCFNSTMNCYNSKQCILHYPIFSRSGMAAFCVWLQGDNVLAYIYNTYIHTYIVSSSL